MTRLVHDTPELRIYQGDAIDCPPHDVTLVLTNPYGPLPAWTRELPMLIHQWRHRRAQAEEWCGAELVEVSGWNDDREVFWAANMPALSVDLSELRPEPGGWYPLELPLRLLETYAVPGAVIWDGFLGRGTVAKAAWALGMSCIGVEQLPAHIALARDYLGLSEVLHGAA